MVPNGWKRKTLSDICKMQAGKFVKASDIYPQFSPQRYPCFGGNGLRGYTESYTHEGIFSLIGRQGALCGNITFAKGKFHATEHAVVTFPNKDIDTDWLYYTLIDLNLNQYATGQAQPGLSVKNLDNVLVLAPTSKAEQQKIAKILFTWDKAIATTEKLIVTSLQQKKALMQQLLTGKKRFVNPDTGKVFEGNWEEHPLQYVLGKIIDYRGQSVPKAQSGIPLITARNVRMGYLDFSSQEYIDENQFSGWMTRGTPQVGDILFTTEAPLGMACRYPTVGIFGVGQRTVTLRVNSKLNSDFLLYYLLSAKGQLLIDLRSSGSTAKGIKSSELKKVKIYYPKDSQEQQKIASVLTTADKEIELLQAKLTHLKDEKKALMQQLLTGKRRVKVDENVAA